jgi:ketosteroid isomerase-like protein
MSRENVEIVRRIYALAEENWLRGKRGETDSTQNEMWDLLDPELVLEEVAEFPDTSTYHGHEGLLRWWSGFFDVYDEVQWELGELIPVGDRVVAQVHQRLRSKAGLALEHEITNVWTLRNGRVTHVTGYRDRSKALEAAGLTEPAS